MPWLRAVATDIAVKVLLWHETQPAFFRNVTSVCCSNGSTRSTAARGDGDGDGVLAATGAAVVSFAPALTSMSTSGVLPCRRAMLSAVSPAAFLALTSTPPATIVR